MSRALDLLVAQALGMEPPEGYAKQPDGTYSSWQPDTYSDGSFARSYSELTWPPEYSGNVACAFELAASMLANGFDHHIATYEDEDETKLVVSFRCRNVLKKCECGTIHYARGEYDGANDVPLGICLSALRALGITIPEIFE